jgi:hypothetical protein
MSHQALILFFSSEDAQTYNLTTVFLAVPRPWIVLKYKYCSVVCRLSRPRMGSPILCCIVRSWPRYRHVCVCHCPMTSVRPGRVRDYFVIAVSVGSGVRGRVAESRSRLTKQSNCGVDTGRGVPAPGYWASKSPSFWLRPTWRMQPHSYRAAAANLWLIIAPTGSLSPSSNSSPLSLPASVGLLSGPRGSDPISLSSLVCAVIKAVRSWRTPRVPCVSCLMC